MPQPTIVLARWHQIGEQFVTNGKVERLVMQGALRLVSDKRKGPCSNTSPTHWPTRIE